METLCGMSDSLFFLLGLAHKPWGTHQCLLSSSCARHFAGHFLSFHFILIINLYMYYFYLQFKSKKLMF
jgi:hypothetical protein